ncbi:hypothetical protein D3C76_19020 [compost metagenome]
MHIVPQLFQQLFPGNDRVLLLHQLFQQLVFIFTELFHRSLAGNAEITVVQMNRQRVFIRLRLARIFPVIPAQNRHNFGQQDLNIQWLDDIIIRAQLHAEHLAGFLISGGDHNDRHRGLSSEHPAIVESVIVRQIQVKQHEVRRFLLEDLLHQQKIRNLHHFITVLTQDIGYQGSDFDIILDDHDLEQ